MTDLGELPPDAFDDALIAAQLCAHDPVGLGGMVLRGGGDLRDAVLAELRRGLPVGAPLRRVPPHIDDEALLGGLDLTATLGSGRAVLRRGLLADADGGVVVVAMAERLPDAIAARIASVVDAGATDDGSSAEFALLVFDDGVEAEERAPVALMERVAFHLDLSATHYRPPIDWGDDSAPRNHTLPFSERIGAVAPDKAVLDAIATTAFALGIDSARAPLFALRAACAAAEIAGRDSIAEADVILAARLVLGPRATRMPTPPEQSAPEQPPPPPENDGGEQEQGEPQPLEDVVLEAVLASLPRDLLARIAAGQGRRNAVSRARGAGERRKSKQRGRPMGARAGVPGGGLRLSLIDTLRAAAPWQKLRQQVPGGAGAGQIRIRRDDLRIRRFETAPRR